MSSAWAFPTEGPRAFCEAYPESVECVGVSVGCTVCHVTPPALNPYGQAVRGALGADGVAGAVLAIDGLDSDGDGWSNGDEIELGLRPGDDLSTFEPIALMAGPDDTHLPGTYDPGFALRRLSIAFCGVGPSYDEMQALAASDDPRSMLHTRLDACLASDYWRHEAVPRLADDGIRPLLSLGNCTNLMADYEFDYRLFAYAMTGGRDARLLLTADMHIERGPDGRLRPIDEDATPIEPPRERAGVTCTDPMGNTPPGSGGQPLPRAHRAGLLTTQWNLVIRTQATYLPRTTAAHAMRAWLGVDFARYEGLSPVGGEPRDIDLAGVGARPCVDCHSTLDPMAYAFAYYHGVTGFRSPLPNGAYDRDRPTGFFRASADARAAWADAPPVTWVLGQPIEDAAQADDTPALVEVGAIMAGSPEFARHLARLLTVEALGAHPGPREQSTLDRLVEALVTHDYAVDAMLHALIDTDTFGAP